MHGDNSRQVLYRIIVIVYRQAADQSRNVVYQFPLFGFYYRTFAGDHDFGKFPIQAVYIGYVFYAVGRFLRCLYLLCRSVHPIHEK